MDDLGTGYSSFSHLEQLPIDILKVDRSFVANVANLKIDSGRASRTRAIVQLAHTLGLLPIAEGVEEPEQVPSLRDVDCNLAQGHHLGMPLIATETEELLRSLVSSGRTFEIILYGVIGRLTTRRSHE